MAEKIPCSIVQDLLPQHAEQLLTPESEGMVQKHLEECESCRKIYEQMTDPEPVRTEDYREVDYLKKVRKSRTKLMIGAVVAVVCVAAGLLLYFKMQAGKTVVNYDEASQTVVVYGKEADTKLELPEEAGQAKVLDAQYESFHMSTELDLLRMEDQSPDEYLSAYLSRTNQSLQFLRKYLKENCADQYPYERAAKYVDISILSDGDYSWTELEDRILVELGSYYWHREEVYLLSLLDSKNVEWKQLGYVWYLGSCVDPYGEVLASFSAENLEGQLYADAYRKGGGTDESSPENYRILNDAVSYICLTKGMNWGTAYESIPLKNTALYRGPQKKNINPGNDMSVSMATSFIAFLSDRYGFDKVSAFCFGQNSFENAFSTDYESAYNDWTEWIIETYGG